MGEGRGKKATPIVLFFYLRFSFIHAAESIALRTTNEKKKKKNGQKNNNNKKRQLRRLADDPSTPDKFSPYELGP